MLESHMTILHFHRSVVGSVGLFGAATAGSFAAQPFGRQKVPISLY